MQTLGIDLSTDPKKVWTCEVDWSTSPPHVSVLEQLSAVDDPLVPVERGLPPERAGARRRPSGIRTEAALIAGLVERITAFAPSAERVVGVAAPLGWPTAFVEAVSDWDDGDLQGFRKRPDLRLRATDRFVQALTRITPMSVSTDRTGSTAMMLAEVLSRSARALDRKGFDRCAATDGIAEVHPVAALRLWTDLAGLPLSGSSYKSWRVPRETIVLRLMEAGLELTPLQAETMCRSDDALDAFVCALVARAAALGNTVAADAPVDVEHLAPNAVERRGDSVEAFTDRLDLARTMQTEALRTAPSEGWIQLPRRESLAVTLGTTPGSTTWLPELRLPDPEPELESRNWLSAAELAGWEDDFDDEDELSAYPTLLPEDAAAIEAIRAAEGERDPIAEAELDHPLRGLVGLPLPARNGRPAPREKA